MIYSDLQAQKNMTFDLYRNRAYHGALEQVVDNTTTVLDLGAGLGVHGLSAAKLGAKHVYLVEPENIGSLIMNVARDNGVAERTTWIQGRIEDIKLPEKVDMIVSVFTGNFLLSENLLPYLFLARDRWLNKTGYLIPDKATMYVTPVFAAELHQEYIEIWDHPHLGLNYSACRQTSANQFYSVNSKMMSSVKYITEPRPVKHLDFYLATVDDTSCQIAADFDWDAGDECHGFIGWFDMCLGGHWLSTAPHREKMHWSALYFPIAQSIKRNSNLPLTIKIHRLPNGHWTWQLECGDQICKQSSFFFNFLKHNLPLSAQSNFYPELTQQGQIIQFVLEQFDGRKPISEIIDQVMLNSSPQLTSIQAAEIVLDITSKYAISLSY